jgi:hypothetical protein
MMALNFLSFRAILSVDSRRGRHNIFPFAQREYLPFKKINPHLSVDIFVFFTFTDKPMAAQRLIISSRHFLKYDLLSCIKYMSSMYRP